MIGPLLHDGDESANEGDTDVTREQIANSNQIRESAADAQPGLSEGQKNKSKSGISNKSGLSRSMSKLSKV